METQRSFKIIVKTQRRPDGGLRLWSDDVPELVLSGADPQAVLADVAPALETILSATLGCAVTAHPLIALPSEVRASRGARMGWMTALAAWMERRLGEPERIEFAAGPCIA